MTVREFDAPASNTPRRHYAPPPSTHAKRIAHRIARIVRRIALMIWLAAILVCNDTKSLADYRRRFGVSAWTFRRDVRKLRRTGLYITSLMYGKYLTLFYLMETEDE